MHVSNRFLFLIFFRKLQNNELFGDIPPELFRLSNLEMMLV